MEGTVVFSWTHEKRSVWQEQSDENQNETQAGNITSGQGMQSLTDCAKFLVFSLRVVENHERIFEQGKEMITILQKSFWSQEEWLCEGTRVEKRDL